MVNCSSVFIIFSTFDANKRAVMKLRIPCACVRVCLCVFTLCSAQSYFHKICKGAFRCTSQSFEYREIDEFHEGKFFRHDIFCLEHFFFFFFFDDLNNCFDYRTVKRVCVILLLFIKTIKTNKCLIAEFNICRECSSSRTMCLPFINWPLNIFYIFVAIFHKTALYTLQVHIASTSYTRGALNPFCLRVCLPFASLTSFSRERTPAITRIVFANY